MKSTSIRSHIRFPSRGAERRASLRPVRRRGVLSKLPGPRPVTKRCSRMRRVGALLQREEPPPLGALGPCRRKKPFARTADSSPARLALLEAVGSNVDDTRATGTWGNVPSFSCVATSSFNRGWGLRGGSRRFVVGGPGRAPARSAGAARNRPFSGSCSRSYRCGRNRTNGVIVVEARRTGRPALRAEAKRNRGQPRRRDRRPADGRRSGSSDTWRPFTGRHETVVSAARSQAPPLENERGASSRESEEGRRSAVTGASEGESSVDATGRQRPR